MNALGRKSVQRSPSGQLDASSPFFKIPNRQTDERTSQSADTPIFKYAVTGKRITYNGRGGKKRNIMTDDSDKKNRKAMR